MLPTAKQLVAMAASQIGTVEYPAGSNRTKYGSWYGMNGVAWCDIFVSWCFYMVQGTLIGGKFAYTPSHAAWFRNAGKWTTGTTGIRRGDICFFDFPNDGVTRISHVGIVESVRADGFIVTIEGNTSVADNRNGGMVMRRVRSRSGIVGYGRPAYTPEQLRVRAVVTEATTMRAKRDYRSAAMRVLSKGSIVKVFSKTATWSYVEYGGEKGYVLTSKLDF